jgi:hypothetical protein
MGASSSVATTVKNYNVNKSDLEVLNQQVNAFVSNSVTKGAASCAASSSSYVENTMGDITVVGKGNKAKISIGTDQDTKLSLQCIQQSIQQTNIGNEMAQSIMNNLTQSVSNEAVTKLMQEAEAKNELGAGAPPWGSASSDINVNVETTNITETSRKLSNLISNSVANNVSNEDIKECFMKTAAAISNKVGNINIIGEGNELEFNMTSKQVSESFATCQQLTEQTSAVTNSIATALGLAVVDDTKTKTSTESTSKASASNVVKGLDSVIAAWGQAWSGIIGAAGGLVGMGMFGAMGAALSPSSSISSCICCCVLLMVLMKMGKGARASEGQGEGGESGESGESGAQGSDGSDGGQPSE